MSKNLTATFCNVSHGADSCPHTCILQQQRSYADRKVRKNVEAVLKNQQAKAKRENEKLFKVTLISVRQDARTLPKQTRSVVRKVCSRVYLHRLVWGENKNKVAIKVVNGTSL